MSSKIKSKSIFIRGIAAYPKLHKPYKWNDANERSEPNADGEYSTGVVVKNSGIADNIIASIKEWAKENNISKVKNFPWKEVDGNMVFTGKQYGKDKDGNLKKLPKVDASGNPLPSDFLVTGGSEIVLKVRPSHYKAQGGGIKLYIDAVQVVKYVELDRDFGFDKHDDGFTYGENESSEDSSDDVNEDNGSEDSTDF